MLAAGQSESEILDHYVVEYGDLILAAPAAEGFSLVVYVLPFLLLFLGIGTLVVIIRRWSRRPARQSQPLPLAITPEDAERLRRALQEFDSIK